MQNNRIRLPVLKFLWIPVIFIFLLACSEHGTHPQAEPGKKLPQPGMHVYKDPLTGKFVPRPFARGRPALHVQSQSLPSVNGLESVAKPASSQAQEYKSPVAGGGILLDLPAPYSDP